jgi:hypothetical protein
MNRNKLCIVDPDTWAMPSARATHEPSRVSPSRPLRVSVDYRGASATVRPTFTTRVHREPVPRGHRTYIGKQEWR